MVLKAVPDQWDGHAADDLHITPGLLTLESLAIVLLILPNGFMQINELPYKNRPLNGGSFFSTLKKYF